MKMDSITACWRRFAVCLPALYRIEPCRRSSYRANAQATTWC